MAPHDRQRRRKRLFPSTHANRKLSVVGVRVDARLVAAMPKDGVVSIKVSFFVGERVLLGQDFSVTTDGEVVNEDVGRCAQGQGRED